MRTVVAIMFLLALVATPVLAAENFELELITVDESILPGESALFELIVTNTANFTDRYTIQSEEFSYIVLIDPKPSQLETGQDGRFGIEISPRSFVNLGTYRVPLIVRSQETGEQERIQPIIVIRDPSGTGPGTYTPSIALSVGAPDEVDPRDDITLNVALRNRNPRNYGQEDPLTVQIESDIFYKEYKTQLGPNTADGEKTTEVRMDIDPQQPPGQHPLSVRVLVGNRTVSEQQLIYTITGYSDVQYTQFSESSLFTSTTSYRVVNNGNVDDTARVEYDINTLKRLFVTSSHNYVLEKIDGDLTVVVQSPLAPLEEQTITITENYRLLVLLIILVLASIVGYYLLRSPVVMGKDAELSGTPQEGVSEIKVRLLVKNRSSKTMRHVRVIDRISGMADIVKQQSLGTLKPTKVVKKEGQGTLLRWDIDALEPFEERIISYKARTPLKLVGDLSLPAVKAKFDVPSGRERTAHSNEVNIRRPE